MNERYNKLFSSIVTSSVWVADPVVFKVWVAFLALKDQHGEVAGTIPGFANLCNISIEQMENAEAELLSPDPYSRTPDNDGRRIERVPGGWRVLNHETYQEKAREAHDREQARLRKQRERARVTHVTRDTVTCHAPVTPLSQGSHENVTIHSTQIKNKEKTSLGRDAKEKEPKPRDIEAVRAYFRKLSSPISEADAFFDHFESNGWKVGGKAPMKDWRAAVRTWVRRAQSRKPMPHPNGAVAYQSKPLEGLDYVNRMRGNGFVRLIPGTEDLFDEDEWRENRALG